MLHFLFKIASRGSEKYYALSNIRIGVVLYNAMQESGTTLWDNTRITMTPSARQPTARLELFVGIGISTAQTPR